MNKVQFLFIGLLVMSSSVFAQSNFKLSLGAGLQGYTNLLSVKSSLSNNYFYIDTGEATEWEHTQASQFFGGYLFFDATYVEALFGINGTGTDGSQIDMNFGLLGKFPFKLTHFTLFPLLGIEYDIVLLKKNSYGNEFGSIHNTWYYYKNGSASSEKMELSALNTFWFKGGLGADIALNNKVFLRMEYLIGLAPLNKLLDNNYKERLKSPEKWDRYINYSHTIKFGIGYIF